MSIRCVYKLAFSKHVFLINFLMHAKHRDNKTANWDGQLRYKINVTEWLMYFVWIRYHNLLINLIEILGLLYVDAVVLVDCCLMYACFFRKGCAFTILADSIAALPAWRLYILLSLQWIGLATKLADIYCVRLGRIELVELINIKICTYTTNDMHVLF